MSPHDLVAAQKQIRKNGTRQDKTRKGILCMTSFFFGYFRDLTKDQDDKD